MRTLRYKRTHSNDPDPKTGVFGNRDCMGQVRAWDFDAVIGVGGVGDEPKRHGIAGRLTWIGIGPQKFFDDPDSRGLDSLDDDARRRRSGSRRGH